MGSIIHGKSHKALKYFREEVASLAVYWLYCSRVNSDNVAWGGLRNIATETGYAVNSVRDARLWLVAHGALERVHEYVRPEWRKLSEKTLRRKLAFDRSEYYRPTGVLIVKNAHHDLLYVPIKDAEPDEEAADVSPRASSTAYDVAPRATDLDSNLKHNSIIRDDDEDLNSLSETEKLSRYFAANIARRTPAIDEKIATAVTEHGADTLRAVLTACVEHGAQTWAYVAKALKNHRPSVQSGQMQTSEPETPEDATRADAIRAAWLQQQARPALPCLADEQQQQQWESTYDQLELQLDRASFETWLRGAALYAVVDGVWHIFTRNEYARDMLATRLYRNVRRVLSDVQGAPAELQFHLSDFRFEGEPTP